MFSGWNFLKDIRRSEISQMVAHLEVIHFFLLSIFFTKLLHQPIVQQHRPTFISNLSSSGYHHIISIPHLISFKRQTIFELKQEDVCLNRDRRRNRGKQRTNLNTQRNH